MDHLLGPSASPAFEARRQSRWAFLAARYGLAVPLVALAVAFKQVLAPLGGGLPLDLFIPAVMVVAWLGGLGPGLLAALLSMLAINYFFLPPMGSLSVFFAGDLTALAVFAVVAGLVAWLTLRQRAAMERLVRMLERMSDAFIALDGKARFTYVNAHAEHLLDKTRAELMGRRVWDVLPKLEGGPLAGALRQAASHRRTVTLEDYSVALQRWVEVRAYPSQDGVSLFFRDITERKRVEEALRTSEERFRVSLLHAPLVVFQQDRALRYTWIHNPHPDFDAQEVLGKDDFALLPEEDALELAAIKQQVLATGQGARQEVRTTMGGEAYYYDLTVEPLRDRRGEINGVICASWDITARKQVEREREELLAREQAARALAEKATQARGAVLATVAHDLRNPLTVIRGTAQLLHRRVARRTGAVEPPQLLEGLRSIERSSDRMAALLGELLDAATLEAGYGLSLQREALDLVALAQEVAGQHAREADGDRVRIEATVQELVGSWDRARLERVLDNLLENALKYSPPGGEVVLRLVQQGNWAMLQVQDRGMGIPADDLPRVFERFHRGANVEGRAEGTGLGLWGVRQIVELHGGTIQVESQEGQGTTITVLLPQ